MRWTFERLVIALLAVVLAGGWLTFEVLDWNDARQRSAEYAQTRAEVAGILSGHVQVLRISAADQRVSVSGVRVPNQWHLRNPQARSGATTCWIVADLLAEHRDEIGTWTIAVYRGSQTRRQNLIGFGRTGACNGPRYHDSNGL
jgi:hypothetical protein